MEWIRKFDFREIVHYHSVPIDKCYGFGASQDINSFGGSGEGGKQGGFLDLAFLDHVPCAGAVDFYLLR